jgi:hypothetical protein
MKRCSLVRLDYKTGKGTFGVLLIEGRLFCYTLERPFLYNIKNLSCIPIGIYDCSYHVGSSKSGYLLKGVQDRSGIMIHVGNTIADTAGCILLGKGCERNLTHSAVAITEFETLLKKKDFYLSIEEYN